LNPPVASPHAGENRPVVLLAEDEAIIALELADSLELEGFEVAGPFGTCASAEAWLTSAGQVDGAILDNALKDGPCTALARDLASRDIPFIVYSGHIRSPDTPCEFIDVPWIVKPVPFEALLHSLRIAMARCGQASRAEKSVPEDKRILRQAFKRREQEEVPERLGGMARGCATPPHA
jgi:DNA-binding NtrC family response regulator